MKDPVSEHETSIDIAKNQRLVFSHAESEPDGVSYVRIIDENDNELVLWDYQEWVDDPKCVMGAILGAILGAMQGGARK